MVAKDASSSWMNNSDPVAHSSTLTSPVQDLSHYTFPTQMKLFRKQNLVRLEVYTNYDPLPSLPSFLWVADAKFLIEEYSLNQTGVMPRYQQTKGCQRLGYSFWGW